MPTTAVSGCNNGCTRRPLYSITSSARPSNVGGTVEAEGFGGLEVDHQFELFRGLDGQLARLRALEDAIGIDCRAPEIVEYYISIGEQAAKFNKVPQRIDRG